MRYFLIAALAVLALIVIASPKKAIAADRWVGTITSVDAGTVCNTTTFVTREFTIGPKELISIQCTDAGAWVAADQDTAPVGQSVLLPGLAMLDTSTDTAVSTTYWDGGSYVGGVVCISPLSGNQNASCNINYRNGRE